MEGNTRAGLENGAQHRERQWETIKEKLKGHWHSKGSQPFDKESFLKAALEAGVSWDGAFAVVDMMHYAAAAAQLPVARSGQSAFSWVPLVAVAASAQNMAASDARTAFLGVLVEAIALFYWVLLMSSPIAQVAGEVEGEEPSAGAPPDLAAGAAFLDNLLLNLCKASRLGLAGGAFGRPKSLREGTAGLGGATASQQSLPAQDRSGSELDAVEAAYKRLVEEVSSAQRLRDRAEESLATTQPEDGHGQALTSAAQARPPDSRSPTRSCLQAIFSHQGLRLEAELDELRQAITQAEAALAAAAAALQAAGLDVERLRADAAAERRERLAQRSERRDDDGGGGGGRSRRDRGRRRRGRGRAGGADRADDQADAQSLPEDSEEGAEHGAEAAASTRADMGSSVAGSRHTDGPGGKPRRAGRGARRGSGAGGNARDPTAPREAASEDDEEAAAAGQHAGGGGGDPSAPNDAAGQQEDSADLEPPPGFSPLADGGERRKRERRKRGGRRGGGEGGPAAATEEGPPAPVHSAAPDGCAVQQDAAAEEEAIPGRRTRRPRRRGRGGAREDNGAADGDGAHSQEPAQPNGVAGEQQTFSNPIFADDEAPETLDADATGAGAADDAVVPRRGRRGGARRGRLSAKDMAELLAGIRADLCDPINKEPLEDPVTAADGYTYNRASIEAHVEERRNSPVTLTPLSTNMLFPNLLVKSIIARLAAAEAAPQEGA